MPQFNGKTLFVSRHLGAVQWIKTQPIKIDRFVSHLDVSEINTGDRVIGSLPVHLVAQVCAAGAEYWNLSLEMPAELRGQELSREQLEHLSARLERYSVQLESGLL